MSAGDRLSTGTHPQRVNHSQNHPHPTRSRLAADDASAQAVNPTPQNGVKSASKPDTPPKGVVAWYCHIPGTSSPARPLPRAPGRRGSWSSPAGRAPPPRVHAGRRIASSRSSLRSGAARIGAARGAAGRRRHSAACSRLERMRGRRAGRASVWDVGRVSAGCRRARMGFGWVCKSRARRRSREATAREHSRAKS